MELPVVHHFQGVVEPHGVFHGIDAHLQGGEAVEPVVPGDQFIGIHADLIHEVLPDDVAADHLAGLDVHVVHRGDEILEVEDAAVGIQIVRTVIGGVIHEVGHVFFIIEDVDEETVLHHLHRGAGIVAVGVAADIAEIVRRECNGEGFLPAAGGYGDVFHMHAGALLGLHRQLGLAEAALADVLGGPDGEPVGNGLVAVRQGQRPVVPLGGDASFIHCEGQAGFLLRRRFGLLRRGGLGLDRFRGRRGRRGGLLCCRRLCRLLGRRGGGRSGLGLGAAGE